MTWKKASPFLVVAGIFDALRYMFLAFWFFGPALAALYCTIKVGDVVGTTIGGFACTTGAVVVGFFGAPVFAAFGTIMAIATAFAGFLTIFLLLALFNRRVFKEPTTLLWALVGLGISITITVWRLHSAQIKVEKVAFQKWEKETADARQREQQRRTLQAQQSQQMQAVQAEQMAQQDEMRGEETQREEQEADDGQEPQTVFRELPRPQQTQEWSPNSGLPPPFTPQHIQASQPPSTPPPFTPEYGAPREKWNPNSGTPPPMTSEYGYQTTPPPLPVGVPNYSRVQPPPFPNPSTPPPIPTQERWNPSGGLPPPLTPEYGYSVTPPPLPPPFPPPIPLAMAGAIGAAPSLPLAAAVGILGTIPPPLPYSNISGMKERSIENPELLNKKESSKKFLAEERQKLAGEIRAQRREQHGRLSTLKAAIGRVNDSQGSTEYGPVDTQYGQLAAIQSAEASTLAARMTAPIGLSTGDVQDERENISQLIENSGGVTTIKAKLVAHYEKAVGVSKEQFETIQKSVEQTALRNGVFFVHTIQERERFRHNELSNVAGEATYEDDADILLSLEPTISASSVFSGKSEEGKVSGLWSDTGGFLIGGGNIRFADRNDLNSRSTGIKNREIATGYEEQSIADIDKAAKKRGEREISIDRETGKQEMGTDYNEFIVDNPKIFGYFQPVAIEEEEALADGKYWVGAIDTKYASEKLTYIKNRLEKFKNDPSLVTKYTTETPELYAEKLKEFKQKIDRYKERFEQMKSRGNPLYVMTKNKEMYGYLGVNDDGTVNVGEQLTPEDVAKGRAGLSLEKRKEIGEKILEKSLFKGEKDQREAREIIDQLAQDVPEKQRKAA